MGDHDEALLLKLLVSEGVIIKRCVETAIRVSDRFVLTTPTGYAAMLVPSFALSVLRRVKPY